MNLVWKKIKEEKYRAGYRKMLRKVFILPNGKEKDYDTRDEGKTVCVLAITSDNKVILEKVFRPGPEKVLMEMPGGFVDEGEDPDKAISRELLEETGYSGNFEFVGTVIDDAYSNCERNIFVAKNCKKIQEPKPEDDEEDLEIVEMPIENFKKHLRSGQLTDVEAGFMGLDYLKLL